MPGDESDGGPGGVSRPVAAGRRGVGQNDLAETVAGPKGHWRGNLRLIGWLLALWALATFGVAYFARDLSFSFFGWPFAFFVGAQGAPLLYLLLVLVYAWRMAVLDRRYGVSDEEEDA